MQLIKDLYSENKIHPPRWMISNTQYITMMGSTAYGVANADSDYDYYGFCIPPKHIISPHLAGVIHGFGNQGEKFEQWQQAHISHNGKDYDFQIFNIVKYFDLCMGSNPNMIDSIFTPARCVGFATPVAEHVRDNRKLFLSKECWPKFKGYAGSQLHKIDNNKPVGKRKELVDKYGFDVKFAYHIVRLMDEVEQILMEGDINLERARETLKQVRRGEWTILQLKDWYNDKSKQLEELYHKSELPLKPDEDKIKKVLIECLEMHYASVDDMVVIPDKANQTLSEIEEVLRKYRRYYSI